MITTRHAIKERMKSGVDVVIELLDARLPGSSANPNLPPNPKAFGDLADNNNMQALLAARDAYQNARQAMMDQAKYMSDLMKASAETLKSIGQNVGR